jgi:hypothetical protein
MARKQQVEQWVENKRKWSAPARFFAVIEPGPTQSSQRTIRFHARTQ